MGEIGTQRMQMFGLFTLHPRKDANCIRRCSQVAFVSFRAKYTFKNDKEERVLAESSRFVKEEKRWFYREAIVDDAESKRKWNLGAALYKEPSEEEKLANKMVTKGKPGVAFRKS